MRNLKRFLAMALSVLMVAGSFAAVSARELTDVEATDEYAVAINKLTDIGVVRGYDDDTFKADVAVERWHMALFLARLDSGRVSEEDDVNVWYSEDVVKFDDVVPGNYANAINYVVNYGMVVGTSDTTFEPNAKITYQDALTMVVRALGYGSDEMDKGYPWKYINKANELGLTDDVNAKVQFTSELTRGQTAQILYNALYAVNAEGNTYAEKYMGQTTVIVTGNSTYQIAPVEKPQIKGYVSVNVMNANGTINCDVTYFLPEEAFGEYDEIIGMTFRVNTSDNFQTLDVVEPCDYYTVTSDKVVPGAADNNGFSNKVTVDGTEYKVVGSYSFLYNNQNTSVAGLGQSKDGSNELMLFGNQRKVENGVESADFNYDAVGNILNAKGEIVAYYVPAITGSATAPYAAKLADGVYKPFADTWVDADDDGKYELSTWRDQIAALVGGFSMNANEYGTITNTRDIASTNRFSELKVYDDDVDGLVERAFYDYDCFGEVYNVTNVGLHVGGLKITDAAGAVAGNWVRYNYNYVTGSVVVKEIYEWQDAGVVTGIAGNQLFTTTDQLNVGYIPNYPGARAGELDNTVGFDYLHQTFGYAVEVITEETTEGDTVVLLVRAKKVSNVQNVIFDQIVSINTNGYVKALMYTLKGEKIIADIATVKGYEYNEFVLLSQLYSTYNYNLNNGEVWSAKKDEITGYWHLIAETETKVLAEEDTLTFEAITTTDNNTGLVSTKYVVADDFGELVADKLVNANTSIVVRYYDAADKAYRFVAQTGIPTALDKVEAIAGAKYYVTYCKTSVDNDTVATIYVDMAGEGGEVEGIESSYVVFVANDFGVTVSTDGVLGQTYTYTNLKHQNGKVADPITVYNVQLKPGTFYRVDNGYVEAVYAVPETRVLKDVAKNKDAGITVWLIDGTSAKAVDAGKAFLGQFALKADQPVPPTEEEKAEEAAKAEQAAIDAAYGVVYDAMWKVISTDEADKDTYAYKLLVAELNDAVDALNVKLVAAEKDEVSLDDTAMLKAQAAMEAFNAATGKDMTAKVIADVAPYLPEEAADMAKTRALQCDTVARDAAKKAEYLAKAAEFYALADQTVEITRGDYGDTSVNKDDTLTIAERLAEINDWLEENK